MNRKILLSLAAALLLSGCASVAPSAGGPIMSFSEYAPVDVNIGGIQIANNAALSANPRVSPGKALENYANRRLRASGSEGTLVFDIQQASLNTREVPKTGAWNEKFTLANAIEYTVTMRVGLNAVGRTKPDVKAAFTLERKMTLPGGTSLADRDTQLNELIVAMIGDVDKAVGQNLGENMGILQSPTTFGAPPRPAAMPATTYAPVQPQASVMPATMQPTAVEK